MPVLLRSAGTQGGTPLTKATIWLPRVGAWVADVETANDLPITGPVELVLGDDLTLVGTVSRGSVFEGQLRVRVVAGADGLRKTVKPKHYTAPTLGIVLRDLLSDVGENISAAIAQSLLVTQLEHWTTMAMPAGQAIRCLVPFAGADVVWRHLPDGALWIGRETWTDSGVTSYADVSASPEDDTIEVNLLTPELLPGTLLGGRKVDALEIRATGTSITATAWTIP